MIIPCQPLEVQYDHTVPQADKIVAMAIQSRVNTGEVTVIIIILRKNSNNHLTS